MKKEEREWAILRTVYKENEFEWVTHQDVPDFELRHRGSTAEFGVEVTELYETESHARARSHPTYIGNLLAGGPHMHKDDMKVFEVSKASISDPDGNLKSGNVPAILRESPSQAEHSKAIAELVRRKNDRADEYLESLNHVNLIIMDWYELGHAPTGEYSTKDFLVPDLRSALLEARFREIFLVMTQSDGRQVYRPLQMLLVLESYFLFIKALQSFDSDEQPCDLDDVVPLFVHTAREAGMSMELASSSEEGLTCAIHRGVGISQTPEGIRVLDFHDHDPPSAGPLTLPRLSVPGMAAFKRHHKDFVEANAFMTELAVDAVGAVARYE